jgi:hypothetical protein
MRFQRVQRPTSQNSEASKSSSFTSCPASVQASEALETFATQGKSDMDLNLGTALPTSRCILGRMGVPSRN